MVIVIAVELDKQGVAARHEVTFDYLRYGSEGGDHLRILIGLGKGDAYVGADIQAEGR